MWWWQILKRRLTMDYEKLYKEAFERARKYKEKGYMMINAALDNIFPELKDSEDEMIKKALIRNFTNQHSSNFPTADGFTREQILAWLEKQGEKDSQVILPTFTFDDILALQCCMQAMSKNDEIYKKLQSIHDRLHEVYGLEKQGEQKSTLSKDDKEMLESIITCADRDLFIHKEQIDWLKSLRHKNKWKPSEEQLNAFEHFVRSIGESGYASPYNNNTKLLYSLLNDLKNL